jgi:hypothetical protein
MIRGNPAKYRAWLAHGKARCEPPSGPSTRVIFGAGA